MSEDVVIKNYIEQLERFKRDKRNKEVDLDVLAQELGFSPDDIREIKQFGQSCLQKAGQFLAAGQLEEAWRNADIASRILWDSVQPLLILAHIDLAMAKKHMFNNFYLRDAVSKYQRVLQRAVNHTEALNGLEEARKLGRSRSLRILLGALVVLVVLFLFIPLLEDGKKRNDPTSKNVANQTNVVTETAVTPDNTAEPPASPRFEVEAVVGSNLGLRWDLQEKDFRTFPSREPSYSVRINGAFQAVGVRIYALELNEVWFDENGRKILVQQRTILDEFQAPLESGDVKPISLLTFRNEPAPGLHRVQLEVIKVDAEPRTRANNLGALRLEWLNPQDESYGLEASLRMKKSNVGFREEVFTDFFVGITNSGQARLNELRLQPVFYKNGREVGSGIGVYVVTKSGPYLPGGSTTSVRFINSWKDQTDPAFFDELRIRVLSVE